jgi:hypothetical protein
MENRSNLAALILGGLLCAGLIGLGYLLSSGAVRFKTLDRTVTVKGLSEREVAATVAIWPIRFSEADNDLASLVSAVQSKSALIVAFLQDSGFSDDEISISPPAIIDRQAQGYVESSKVPFRYTATAALTLYTDKVEAVRGAMAKLVELGKQGVAISGQDYQTRTEFLFTELNSIKPAMIEEATRNAREVAEKFAQDSSSRLGKIRRAQQGQFSISDRDSNTPYIKKVRVVSTLEYYLSD